MTEDTEKMFERLVGILEHIVDELERLRANEKVQDRSADRVSIPTAR